MKKLLIISLLLAGCSATESVTKHIELYRPISCKDVKCDLVIKCTDPECTIKVDCCCVE